MPPKKKKSPPIVVGTVSTRSTRRESIVNIKIIPKANRLKSAPKKATKGMEEVANTGSEQTQPTPGPCLENTHPKILEILKDWSDDESSQDDLFSVRSSTSSSSLNLAKDQQSLIDILEGKQSVQVSSQKIGDKKSQPSAPAKKSYIGKDMLMENPIINVDSPKIEEADIIEECIVEDETIIIELIDEDRDSDVNIKEHLSHNVGAEITDKSFTLKYQESSSFIPESITSKSNDLPKTNHNVSVTCEGVKGIQYVIPDNMCQSMVTKDEHVMSDDAIHISDNSISTNEIIEEQFVCDSSEPLIIESLDTVTTDSHSKTGNKSLNKEKENINQKVTFLSRASNFQKENRTQKHGCNIKSEGVEVPDVLAKTDTDETEIKKVIPVLESDENTLCQKISESMQISKELSKNSQIDLTSHKLQESISKMSITSEEDNYADSVTSSKSRKKNTVESISKVKQPVKPNEENKSPITLSVSQKTKKTKIISDTESNISPKSSPKTLSKAKIGSKAVTETETRYVRRSTRRKTEHEFKPGHILKEDSNSTSSSDQCINLDSSFSSETVIKTDHAEKNTETSTNYIEFKRKPVLDSESSSPKGQPENVKISKAASRKLQSKQVQDTMKMEIDSESSETKTSEAEGDSTSNESSQDQTSTKMCKTRRQISTNSMSQSPLVPAISTPEKKMEISTAEAIGNKKSLKGSKSKSKKDSTKEVDDGSSKMDTESFPVQKDSVKILRAEIDATIDEVLRKYTRQEPDTSKDNNTKSLKDLKNKKETKNRKEDKNGESSEEVRRSDRIKTILPVKKKSHGLVRSKSEPVLLTDAENSDSNSLNNDSDKPTPSASPQLSRADKTKSKSKSTENLKLISIPQPDSLPELPKPTDIKADKSGQAEIQARLKTFVHLKENQYKTDRQVCKEARGMICDCYLAEEDIQKDEYGCGEDCLNRLLMIECGDLCQVGGRCTNKRFQKSLFAPVEVFKTEKKGLGLRAAANIAYGEFILEYIGEVLNPDEFDKRAEVYSKDKNIHFYFMSLRADAIIDATMKGNISRFINHSCDPNAETQKWTVNGELRIGFFSTRTILAGEEITFDYRFQRYGKEAQKCYCEAAICRGWLGERPGESEDEEEEEEEEAPKVPVELAKPEIKVLPEVPTKHVIGEKEPLLPIEKMDTEETIATSVTTATPQEVPALPAVPEAPKKIIKKKPRKELLYEDFDQLNEEIEMLVTTGLKNQAHTLKLSRLMVRAKDLDQRKKLLRVLRRGELPCRRLFLDYHGLRLMHGYMIDAQQLPNEAAKVISSKLDIIQTKLELLQTLAVLPVQNKTMLIESKVLPAVEKWAKNEDLLEDSDQKDVKKSPEESDTADPAVNEKIDEIKFLATKLLEEWVNLKESFRIPKKQRIEQMKEHEKEANRKYMESSYAQEKESSRKHDQRYRSWSRCKSERETSKKNSRSDDKDRPSAEYLKISKHERRKLFALQMELKEEERRLKQREMWRQHEMNCMMIGADPRFTAPFDPNKGFQYIWNPSLGQWQTLPVPVVQNQGSYNSPATSQGVSGFNVQPHKQSILGPYATSIMNVPGLSGSTPQYPAALPHMVPGIGTSVSAMAANPVPGMTNTLPGISNNVPGIPGPVHGLPASITGITGTLSGISQPPLPMYQEVKNEDPSQVKFAGPIPPPVKLPPKWKCAKDKYGRPYYYHVKLRKSQWEPPPLSEPIEESFESSSSDSSSGGSSSDSSSDSDTDDEIDDSKLLQEVKRQMESTSKLSIKSIIPDHIKKGDEDSGTPSPEIKAESDNEDEQKVEHMSSIDIRLKEQFHFDSNDPPKKKRRFGLCQEIIISPRTEEDRKQFKEDIKRYKATKEKLKRQKEQMLHQAKKKIKLSTSSEDVRKTKDKRSSKSTVKSRIREMKEWNDEHAKKIKEVFRSTMATTVVGVLNVYRKPDCKEARITNTEDFKHLARKLTHFVMLKEMKHLSSIEELVCSDNVKAKAREYIRKYMSKFGEVYQKRHDEPDFKD